MTMDQDHLNSGSLIFVVISKKIQTIYMQLGHKSMNIEFTRMCKDVN